MSAGVGKSMKTTTEKYDSNPLQMGEIGILQNLNRKALNGMIAEVIGELRMRMLYSLSNPADSEICLAYKVRVPGYPQVNERVEWCVKSHQLRRIDGLDDSDESECAATTPGGDVVAEAGMSQTCLTVT
jgi:hypothetical protein